IWGMRQQQFLKTNKGGWGWGSISLARTRNSTIRFAYAPQTVQFRIVGAIEMRANSAVISMALRQNWAKMLFFDEVGRRMLPSGLSPKWWPIVGAVRAA